MKILSSPPFSCRPNITRHFDIASFSFRFYAVRDIAEGEEMTTAYCKLRCPTEERQACLQPYRFTCTCAACKNSVYSDKLRKIIAEPDYTYALRFDPTFGPLLQKAGFTNTNEPTRDQFIRKTRLQIAMLEREGLESDLYYLGHLSLLCLALDQEEHKEEVEALKAKVALFETAKGENTDSLGGKLDLPFDGRG